MTDKFQKSAPKILQEHPEGAPDAWAEVQDQIAADEGLAVLLVDGPQPPAIIASLNNSICQAFQSSPEHVGLCNPYCGDAHRRAMAAGHISRYKCHAGLECFTMPVKIGRRRKLATIGGRAFITGADYRALMERFRSGELKTLVGPQTFSNVLFSDEQKLSRLAERLEKATRTFVPGAVPVRAGEKQDIVTQAERVVAPKIESEKPSDVQIQLEAEVARLRGEIEYRTRLDTSLQHFLERISSSEADKTYSSILANSSELLKAGRASLMVYDEVSNELVVKAAIGISMDRAELERLRLGDGISGAVLESGRPLVVRDIGSSDITASRGRNYRSRSFISYPITIGGRKIGVINVTDKAGGGYYDDIDLSLLEIIGPQIAVALERAEWQERANEFQLMSITDPLTGLPNRRYLEERLGEELNRSKRYGYPMSFLMIDIDDFKSYNDLNGHQAGDLALQMTAHCLKATLRAADVASRYGGEEFCILLPQTPLNEAEAIAERVRQRVSSTTYPHGKSQPLGMVTISMGIATFGRHIDTAERVIAAADRALYSAKSKGKNRVEIYEENLT